MEIMGNLVDNAFKWAVNSVEITAEPIDDRICLRISDDGIGIEGEKLEELMQRGKRADQTTDGHGIGLSIVNNIVQAYHGSLQINPSRSGGAEVTVLI
jgi:two-component system sensor histidine kinase PhoQ